MEPTQYLPVPFFFEMSWAMQEKTECVGRMIKLKSVKVYSSVSELLEGEMLDDVDIQHLLRALWVVGFMIFKIMGQWLVDLDLDVLQ